MAELMIAASSQKTADSLCGLLVPRFYPNVDVVLSAAKARRAFSQREYQLVIISAPLPDESGDGLAQDACRNGATDVVLLTGGDRIPAQDLYKPSSTVLILEKPVNRTVMEITLRVLQTARQRNQRLLEENRKLAAKLEESRLVGRAKCALISYRQMTEEEAHHYIEHMAMDSRLPKKEIARDILHTFEG